LLQEITVRHGTREQQLAYLRDPYLGPESTIAKGEWGLWRSKLRLMAQAGLWQELNELTHTLLTRARTKDKSGEFSHSRYCDWAVWEVFVKSAHELPTKESVPQNPLGSHD
jgi:N-terminal acetyltransferase B complex non-catalytic subunit